MIPLIKPVFPEIESYTPKFEQIYKSGHFSNNGQFCRQLEEELAGYMEVKHAMLMTNGTIALCATIMALGLPPKSTILVPNFTFAATIQSIYMCGHVPQLADVCPWYLTLELNEIHRHVRDDRSVDAVLAVNTFGGPCNYYEIGEICKREKIPFIVDSAGAIGTEYEHNGIVGGIADMECFSMHATKLLPMGEGGLVTTNNNDCAEYIRSIRNFGLDGSTVKHKIALNGKVDEFRAAIGIESLKNLPTHLTNRMRYAEQYRAELKGYDIEYQREREFSASSHQLFPLIFKNNTIREMVKHKLDTESIGNKIYYTPFSETYTLQVTDDIYSRILCVPMHSVMTEETITTVCDVIKEVLDEARHYTYL